MLLLSLVTSRVRTATALLSAALAVVLVTGCGDKPSGDASTNGPAGTAGAAVAEPKPEPPPPPPPKPQLKPGLSVGDAFVYEISLKTESGAGSPMASSFNILTEVAAEVTANDEAASTTDVKFTYERISGKLSVSMMGVDLRFDTDQPELADSHPMGAMLMGGMSPLIGAEITPVVGADGSLVELKGIDELVKKLSADGPPPPGQDPAKMFRSECAMLFPKLPAGDLDVGSKWASTRELEYQGATFALTVAYAVTEITDDEIAVAGEVTGTATGAMMRGMVTLGDPKGTASARFSRRDGLMLEESIEVESSMEMGGAMGGMGGEGMGDTAFTLVRDVRRANADE